MTRPSDGLPMALGAQGGVAGGGAKAHALLGYIYMSQGQLVGAERELAQAVRLDPGDEADQTLTGRRETRDRGKANEAWIPKS